MQHFIYKFFIGLACTNLIIHFNLAHANPSDSEDQLSLFPSHTEEKARHDFSKLTAEGNLYSVTFPYLYLRSHKLYRIHLQFLESKPTEQYPHSLFKMKVLLPNLSIAMAFFGKLLEPMGLTMVAAQSPDGRPQNSNHVLRLEATRHQPPFEEEPVGIRASIYSAENSTSPIPLPVLIQNGRSKPQQPTQETPTVLQIYVDSSHDIAVKLLEALISQFHLTHVEPPTCATLNTLLHTK